MIDEKRLATPPIQHIRNLFESINDGKLTVTYYDPIEPSFTKTYEVSCAAADADAIVAEYEALVRALETIGKAHARFDNGENPEGILTPTHLDVWNTYVRDFDEVFDAGEYNLDDLYQMREMWADLTDEEYEVLERHHEWFEEQCLKRLPKKDYSPMLLMNRVQRYEYLISCNAPKSVIDEEGRRIAEEMILYRFCTKEIVSNILNI